jgi:Helix-hairpin-helix motif
MNHQPGLPSAFCSQWPGGWGKFRWLAVWAGLLAGLALAQAGAAQSARLRRPASEADLDQFIQNLFAVPDGNLNYEDAYESLFLLYTNPLDLNAATRQDLEGLYVLTTEQIGQFLAYRQRYGALLAIFELAAVPGFDQATIDKILPFVEVPPTDLNADNQPLWRRLAQERNNMLLLRYERTLEPRRGYRPATDANGQPQSHYLGSPDKWYARFRVSHARDFSLGFTLEKDAGEPLAWAPAQRQYGPGFISGHAAVYNRGRLKALQLGDYQMQVGQGLLLSAGFVVGKGAETVATVRRPHTGLRPYTSVLEGGFLRGAAATFALGRVEVTGLASLARRSASLTQFNGDTLSDEEAVAGAIIPAGLHRTPRELANKNALRELTLGATATYRSPNKRLEAGGTTLFTGLDNPIAPPDRIYNRFEFQGRQNFLVGAHASYHWRNFNLFAEAAHSASGGLGLVGGLLAGLSAKVETALLWRRYDRHFHSFYGNAFSEGTRAINEQGVYWGLKFKPNPRWQWVGYIDTFRFPWLRFQVDAPSQGHEFLTRLTYTPNKKVLLYAQYRLETKGRNLRDHAARLDPVVPSTRQNYQLNADFRAERVLSFRSRVQWSHYQQAGGPLTGGLALVQDVTADLGLVRLSTRFAVFDTDDFDNRQYVFEKDVLYAFNMPAYFGRGFRNYWLLQLNLGRRADLWVRYAYTRYRDQATISSGLEQIDGNRRRDVKVQLRLQVW